MTTTTVLEALKRLEDANNVLCALRTEEMYLAMLNAGQQEALIELDNARSAARATIRAANAKPDQVDATAQEPLTFDIVPCEGEQGRTGYRVWMRRGGASRVVFATHHEPSAKHELAKLQRMFGDVAIPQPAQAQQEPVMHDPVAEFQNEMAQHWAACGFVPDGANPDHIYAAMNSGFTGGWNAALQTAAQPVQPITDEREAIRNAALEEAAQVVWRMQSRPEFGPDDKDKWLKIAEKSIRALQSPHPEVREQAPEKVGK